MQSRRVLITGLSTYWGGRLAQQLEQDPSVETVIGVDSRDPTRELERTEFVRVGTQHALIRRIVDAAEIDTVVDTRLTVDSVTVPPREAHENNVIGTMNILAACGGPDSPVRKVVFKSSAHWYGCEQDDPAFFTESMRRPHPPRTPIERDIVEAESAVAEFAAANPDATVTVLRFANGLGAGITTSHMALLSLPLVPTILGFDPRYQFIHEDDIVGALEHAVRTDLDGVYNGAADGVLVLSEVVDLLGKTMAPLLPPWGTGLAARPLRRLGVPIPDEMLNQMRFGRALDNRRLKASGYVYRYTTREAVLKLREHLRLRSLLRSSREPYRYEREVEEFLRWSPSVRHRTGDAARALSPRQVTQLTKLLSAATGEGAQGNAPPAASRPPEQAAPGRRPAPVEEYDSLEEEEVVGLLGSLERADLEALRRHEAGQRARTRVLVVIDGLLAAGARRAPPRPPG